MMAMKTAAQHLLMVFFPNRTIARTESENAAKLHNFAAVPTRNNHKDILQRYCGGLGCSGSTAMRTIDVPTNMTVLTATTRFAKSRLMRKTRSDRRIDWAIASGTIASTTISPPTRVMIVIKMA